MHDIQQIPNIYQKSPPLSINDKKIAADEQIPANKQKRKNGIPTKQKGS